MAPTVTWSVSSAPAIQPSSQQPQAESRSSSSSLSAQQATTSGTVPTSGKKNIILNYACIKYPLPFPFLNFPQFFLIFFVGQVCLNDGMSDEQFVEWLRDSGMTQSGDRDKIIGINRSRRHVVNCNSESNSSTGRPVHVLRYGFIGKAAFCHASAFFPK